MTGTVTAFSTSAGTAEPTPAQASREVLDSPAAQRAAIDRLLAVARRKVLIFDDDLSRMGWESRDRAEALARILKGGRGVQVDFVLHRTEFLLTRCPRLLALLRHHSGSLRMLRSGPEAAHAMDPMLIVDDRHYLHRFHADQPRAELVFDDPGSARPLAERFRAIEATAEPAATLTVLGL